MYPKMGQTSYMYPKYPKWGTCGVQKCNPSWTIFNPTFSRQLKVSCFSIQQLKQLKQLKMSCFSIQQLKQLKWAACELPKCNPSWTIFNTAFSLSERYKCPKMGHITRRCPKCPIWGTCGALNCNPSWSIFNHAYEWLIELCTSKWGTKPVCTSNTSIGVHVRYQSVTHPGLFFNPAF